MKKFTSSITFLILMLCICLISGCTNITTKKQVTTITVSAAASLTPFMDEIITSFGQEFENVEVLINYGSSGALQKQIEQGAPTDLFISAGKKQIDSLAEKNLLVDERTTSLLTNTLVVIEPKKDTTLEPDDKMILEDIFATRHPDFIALGEADTVPAGIYAKQALEHQAMWEEWKDHFVYGKDVREVLAYVEQGNADFGIVYASDAQSSDKVTVTYHIPNDWHDPILYIGAVVKASEQQELANQFLSFMQDERWTEMYEQNGFQKVE